MHLFGVFCIGVGGYPYLPGSFTTWGEVKTTLCSGLNELGLWATILYVEQTSREDALYPQNFNYFYDDLYLTCLTE